MFDDLWDSLAERLIPVVQDYRRRLTSLEVSQKEDRTLLTEADLEVEALIVDAILAVDPGAWIIAEESGSRSGADSAGLSSRVWVIDPIDGTAEFVRPEGREFCSVVCLLQDREPVVALVLAPELGADRTPLTFFADRTSGVSLVNNSPIKPAHLPGRQRWASVTRSAASSQPPFESLMIDAGFRLKTRTTSQTLDMVRTAANLADLTDLDLPQFDLFFRKEQKIWDGVAGLCIGASVGLASVDSSGASRTPLEHETLSREIPSFESTIMGLSEAVEWFLEIA